jgi:hypothetical protein
MVFPMVTAGGSNDEVILSEDDLKKNDWKNLKRISWR